LQPLRFFVPSIAYTSTPLHPPGRYEDRIEAFIKEQRQSRWQSEETCRVGRGQVVTFLSYLEEQGCDLASIDVGHIDVYFQHIAPRLSRTTLRNVATGLRAWFRFCAAQGWTQPGLADAILLPRIYRHERLPLGPTWDQVSRMIDEASGDEPASLRNRAILLLLSVYGLRSGEVPAIATRRYRLAARSPSDPTIQEHAS
jgi:integrase/recombinase XerD